jgi:hypothetical protein
MTRDSRPYIDTPPLKTLPPQIIQLLRNKALSWDIAMLYLTERERFRADVRLV